jgi:hypothetical protein
MKEEGDWVKKVGLAKIKKLDWSPIDEPIVKEMVNNYNHANQYVKLKGRQINVRGVAKIFGLSYERVVPIGRESYNPIVATYFIKYEHKHFIPCSRYMIAKANGRQKVARLEAPTDIMSLRQGNKFVLGALILTMLVVEKEKVNGVVWFSQKLQNEIIAI